MTEVTCFKDVLNQWPDRESLAEDIRTRGHPNITNVHVQSWANRNNIPSGYWQAFVSAASDRGFSTIDHKLLAKLAALKVCA